MNTWEALKFININSPIVQGMGKCLLAVALPIQNTTCILEVW